MELASNPGDNKQHWEQKRGYQLETWTIGDMDHHIKGQYLRNISTSLQTGSTYIRQDAEIRTDIETQYGVMLNTSIIMESEADIHERF